MMIHGSTREAYLLTREGPRSAPGGADSPCDLTIALSLTLRASRNRPANLALGLLFTLVNVSNLVGESWVYYFLFRLLEIALTLTIVATAWNWPRHDPSVAGA
jgi:hypothetical protein